MLSVMADSEKTPVISDPLTAPPSSVEDVNTEEHSADNNLTEGKGSEDEKHSEQEEGEGDNTAEQEEDERQTEVEKSIDTDEQKGSHSAARSNVDEAHNKEAQNKDLDIEQQEETTVQAPSLSQVSSPDTLADGEAPLERGDELTRSTELGPRLSIDPQLLLDLEAEATRLTESSMELFSTLRASLYDISKVTRLSTEAYQVAVDQYSRSTDTAMRHMMQLISRCEELDRAMIPMYELAAQIKQIKRQLDVLETLCKTKR